MRQQIIRGIAGTLILTGILLSIYVNQNWLWLSAFVGANLLQYAFTNWCLMNDILKKLGVEDKCENT